VGYSSERNGGGDVYARSADGVGAERQLTAAGPYRNSPHANLAGDLVAIGPGPDGSADLLVFRAAEPDVTIPFAASPGVGDDGEFSPDSRLLAYMSARTGNAEVYVAPYPEGPTTHEWKVTTTGGAVPQWSLDGRSLFYWTRSGIWRVQVTSTEPFETGSSQLFVEYEGPENGWDVAPDGSHIIGIEALPPPRPRLIPNWFAELKRRLPTR